MSGIGMSKNMKLVHIAAIVAVAAFICATAFVIKATPPSGISFSPVGRATVPEFSVKRKDKARSFRDGIPLLRVVYNFAPLRRLPIDSVDGELGHCKTKDFSQ